MESLSGKRFVIAGGSGFLRQRGDGARTTRSVSDEVLHHLSRPRQQESELRVDLLSRHLALGGEAHRWAELIERVNAGDMPPEGEPRPTQDEIETFVTRVDSLIREGRAARMAASRSKRLWTGSASSGRYVTCFFPVESRPRFRPVGSRKPARNTAGCFSTVLLDWIEWEEPLETEFSAAAAADT